MGSFTFKLQKFAIPQLRRRNHSNVASQENELQIANNGLGPQISTEGAEKPILLEIPKKFYPRKS